MYEEQQHIYDDAEFLEYMTNFQQEEHYHPLRSSIHPIKNTAYGTKEYVDKIMAALDVIYVTNLNRQGTKMMFWYVVPGSNRLEKLWIDIMAQGKDIPGHWRKAGPKDTWPYCFKSNASGAAEKAHECLVSVYNWLGSDYTLYMPKIEALN